MAGSSFLVAWRNSLERSASGRRCTSVMLPAKEVTLYCVRLEEEEEADVDDDGREEQDEDEGILFEIG